MDMKIFVASVITVMLLGCTYAEAHVDEKAHKHMEIHIHELDVPEIPPLNPIEVPPVDIEIPPIVTIPGIEGLGPIEVFPPLPWESPLRVIAPRKNSPHWDHILISDFGHGYYWSPNDALKADNMSWFAEHCDLSSQDNDPKYIPHRTELLILNPTLTFQSIALDYVVFPDMFAWPEQLLDLIVKANNATKNGDIIDVGGKLGYAWTMNRTEWNMWRLTAYYMMKEMSDDLGKAYFNVTFSSNFLIKPVDDRKEWFKAYQVNVGTPLGPAMKYYEVDAQKTDDGSETCKAKFFTRDFTKAFMIVRTRDFWNCTNRDDTSLVTVTLPQAMKQLKPNGTVGELITTIKLRNADSAIFMKE